jgi:hypothetical protein
VRWIKKGLVYKPAGQHEWNKSHAQLPVVDASDPSRWRVYFATRDAENRSRIGYVEVEAGRPENVLYEHDRPVLPLGELGAFDESGIMPVCVVNRGGRKHLYYAGWSLKRSVPYHNAIGLAVSDDGGESFTKYAPGPLFDARLGEPYFTGTAHVVVEGARWRMWYQSCTKWALVDGRPEPFYHLKYTESADGVNWERRGVVAVDYKDEGEGGISAAAVLKEGGGYRMWYSHRAARGYREGGPGGYRIGYAESGDGVAWARRDDEAGIDVSDGGWDSEMIAYPFVLKSGGARYLFYNGNGFGRSGFGYAVSE